MNRTGATGGDGKCDRAVIGCCANHTAVYILHGNSGFDITGVGSMELGYDHHQIRIVGDDSAGNVPLIVNNDIANRTIEECLAGQVVGQILQRDAIRFLCVVVAATDTCLTDNNTVLRILAVVGDIHIHTAGSIAQIEACTVLYIGVTVSTEISTVSAVMIDKAAVSEVACDSVFIEAVAGNGNLCASVNKVSANHGPGVCIHIALCLCIAFANGVQLDGCIVTDIGGSVLRSYRSVDICPVVGRDVRFVNIGICVKIDVLCAVCIHIRTQRRTLGVSLAVNIEAADVGHDIHEGTLDDRRIRLGAFADDIAVNIKHSGADVYICIQRNRIINVGSGCSAKAGRIGAAVAVDFVFRAVCLDVDGTKPVADFCGTNIHCGCRGHIHSNIDLCHGNAALGIDAGSGGDVVSPACLSNDIQSAEVCLDIRAVQNIDGCCTHQRISCIDTAGCNESGALLGGFCGHDCIGNGMSCEVEVSIHCSLKVDDVYHIHSVLALGLVQIDDTACGAV